eukprot:TRINITY_DN1095_c0_g1_i1.p1 TRINITY_DN1095_c0_g1~~TRINITY_DN1095_c0_g1_i1.p1  ORF type:complete len:706 (-),score=319.14 TRINITY_DN1095_c0_g1_i1:125-2242(-)
MFKLKNIKKNDMLKYANLKNKYFHSSALLNMKMYDRKKNEMGSKIKMMNNNNNIMNRNNKMNKNYRTAYDYNNNAAYNYVSIRRYALEGPPKIKFTKDDDNKKGWISTTITKTIKYIPEWKTVKIKLKNLPEVIKEELIHYYKGFKLLFKNMKLSTQLALRILKGEKLKRSESALLERTVADTFRLVPFIIILVVPFMEFTLPVLLKLFPNMLPSTFTTKDQKQQKIEKQIHARLGLAKFLQGATEKLLLEELKGGISEEDFLKFTKKIKGGEYISNDEIIKIGRVFKNKFELNNLSAERVQALCEFFGISKLGPRSFLLFQLDSKLKNLKNDDEQILSQGTEDLSMEELVQINMQRGMKIEGRNRAMLVKQLYDWIQLSTNKEVPKFLLLLSRSFSINQGSAAISSAINQLTIEEIKDIIKDLPDEAEEFQKRIDELNEIQKEKKREEKEKKEQEELKRKEEEELKKKKKEEEEIKRKHEEEEKEKQRLLEEEQKKKKEEDEKLKAEEEEKKKLEEEKLKLQEEQKPKQVEEEKKGDLKTELGEIESEQKFIQQLEERAQSHETEKLTDKVEEIIEKSKQQIEKLEKLEKETVVTVETDKVAKDDEVSVENIEVAKDQQDTQEKLEEDTELLDKELETVSVDQKFIQQLEEKAQVKEVEMLTDKIEEMIERSKAELEKLQKSSPSTAKKEDEKKVDEEKKEDDL